MSDSSQGRPKAASGSLREGPFSTDPALEPDPLYQEPPQGFDPGTPGQAPFTRGIRETGQIARTGLKKTSYPVTGRAVGGMTERTIRLVQFLAALLERRQTRVLRRTIVQCVGRRSR